MSFNYEIKHTDGINYLEGLDKNTINLILTDPPYITSQKNWYGRTS